MSRADGKLERFRAAEPQRFTELSELRVEMDGAHGESPPRCTVLLRVREPEGNPRRELAVHFLGVVQLRQLGPWAPPVPVHALQVDDVSDRQLEGLHYCVRDYEGDVLELLCEDFEFTVSGGEPSLVERLRCHAGFGSAGGPSLSATLWPAGEPDAARAVELVDDVLAILADLNHELNGPAPSAARSAATVVDRRVAYAVAEISAALREAATASNLPELSRASWQIDTAWRAVLAGDIDDLGAHLEVEERARR